MEELDALLERESHYLCEDYLSHRCDVVSATHAQKRGLASLPAPVLINMLQECASLVTDRSFASNDASPLNEDVAVAPINSSAPGSPASVSGIHASTKRTLPEKSQQSAVGISQDFAFWRQQMCNWAFVVVDNFEISRETVSVAFNLLDRYVSHEQNVAGAPGITREDYQLFAMTALYIAVKVLEPYPRKIAVDALVVMSRHFYSEEDILHTERDMLMALDWKINVPTVLTFCRNFMDSMGDGFDRDEMERVCTHLSERIVSDAFFVPLKNSVIGLACVMHAANMLGCCEDSIMQMHLHHICPLRREGHDAWILNSVLEKLDKIKC